MSSLPSPRKQTLSGTLEDESTLGNHKNSERIRRLRNAMKLSNNGKSKAGLGGVGVNASADPHTEPSINSKKSEARCAAGLIENVALLGAPVSGSPARWERVARIVHGRIVNGFSKSDVILGLVFRAKSLSLSVAGVQKVRGRGIVLYCRVCAASFSPSSFVLL